MSRIRISEVTPQEYNKLIEIHNAGFSNHIKRYGYFMGMRKLSILDITKWKQTLVEHLGCLLKAEVQDDLIGYCYAGVKTGYNENGKLYSAAYIQNMEYYGCSLLCVLPMWRRKGIGCQLLTLAESFFQSKGFKFIVAWAYSSDHSAQNFLQKAGYNHHREFFVEDFSTVLPLNADVELWQKDLVGELVPNGITVDTDYNIRPLRSGDEYHYIKIYNSIWGLYGHPSMNVERSRKILYNQENVEVFFAEVKGKPVGCTIINRDGMINLVGIIPEYRQKGIGTTLLTNTLKYLKQIGHKISYMGSGVPLKGALTLYKKLGYKKLEELHCMVKEL